MKLYELMEMVTLLETSKDDQVIENIAHALCNYIIENEDEILYPSKKAFALKDKTISQCVGSKVLSHLYNRLRAVEFGVRLSHNSTVHGEYFPHLKAIICYIDSSEGVIHGEQLKINREFVFKEVKSVIVHEIRHALDASLAGAKGFDSATTGEYKEQTAEINARFAQAQQATNAELDKTISTGTPMTFDEYLARFKYYAAKFDLISIFSNAENKTVDDWLHFVEKGIFSRPISSDAASTLLPGLHNAGAFHLDDKRFKRLLTRIFKMYQFKISQKRK